MTKAGLEGMQISANEVLALARTLTDDEWQMPSAAERWSVQDVVAHSGNLLATLVDAVNGRLEAPDGIEAENDRRVDRTREYTPSDTIEFVETQLGIALPVLTPLQDEPMASTEAQLLDLGSYPLHAIVDMFTFDFTTHLRWDILGPRGPIVRDIPPLDEAHLGPALSWVLGGIAKMQPDLWKALTAPIQLVLTGPAATAVVLAPSPGAIWVEPDGSTSAEPVATIQSSSADILAWSTTRIPWRSAVEVTGDQAVAASFLDALNLT
jgi:uncharacterized protein (TIGR03083 family)